MFGYILINKPEMKFKEYDVYHSYYCGLCKTLKQNYGIKAQFTLNYDLTFLGIFLSGLYEPSTKMQRKRCMIHPISKHLVCRNDCIDYVAKMSLLLTYQKCQDDILDEHKYYMSVYKKVLEKHYLKIKKEYPEKVSKIERYLDKIHECEKNYETNLDKIAGYFGNIMGEICIYKEDEWKEELYQFGFYLGKFIYLIDAYDDIEEDQKKGTFNPFLQNKSSLLEEEIQNILEMMISNTTMIFERLPIIEHAEIIRNILYSGVWTKYELIKKRRKEKQVHGSV